MSSRYTYFYVHAERRRPDPRHRTAARRTLARSGLDDYVGGRFEDRSGGLITLPGRERGPSRERRHQ
jgi:hypothetical protein